MIKLYEQQETNFSDDSDDVDIDGEGDGGGGVDGDDGDDGGGGDDDCTFVKHTLYRSQTPGSY